MRIRLFWITAAALLLAAPADPARAAGAEDEPCIECHESETPGVVDQWRDSRHGARGVGCYDCHRAKKDDPSGFDHNDARVTAIVTPKRCGICHPKAVREFQASLHDESGFFSASALGIVAGETLRDGVTGGQTKNYKAHFSRESAEAGCLDCHGTVIEVAEDGSLTNWPNVGMGRFNPDGSVGSCSACHTRHRFSVAQARKPETCGQCHLGPDHPQREIYEESKHGNLYAANGESWNWDAPGSEWGPDDIEAPTCATCHMSGFGGALEPTHNVSARLKWELEPVFSWPTDEPYLRGQKPFPIDPVVGARYEAIHDLPEGTLKSVPTGGPNPFALARQFLPELSRRYIGEGRWWARGTTRFDALAGDAARPSEEKREDMIAVCTQCHSRAWAEGDLKKADAMIDVYNAVVLAIREKYYRPLKDAKLDADILFNGKSEADNLWHEIWHHEGRIWRMGAFMQGQDWQHWEGAYEVADDGSHMAEIYERLRIRQAVKEKLGL